MQSRYLDPKIDLAFKRVFGEHAHLLKSFLNAVLPLPDDGLIDSLEYLTPKQVPELPGLFKNSIVNVKCQDARGRIFIVEMQMLWGTSFEQRIVFSASNAYVKQLRSGQNHTSLKPVYALALTNQVFDLETDNYHHHYKIVSLQDSHRVLKGLEFVFIELPKFKPRSQTDRRMQVKWLRFMSEVGHNDQAVKDLAEDPEIGSAMDLLEVGAYTPDELEAYHIHMDKLRIESTVITDAKAEGKAEGTIEAIQEVARNLKAQGLPWAVIAQATGLDLSIIENL
ncbi:MAG: Rpn family recombination-promoting nuclease/putative transposase [Hydrogenophaga sp.]|uniref:Rpn family recombination-promoting nuclease/putative transposase n=1 Tax=Hydrogenophaga sp. TaxID=1904254 RepID=UPI0027665B77|nr:Rpn family recombination-promoting nuclease/putative transposase [Hydrogenophaga sp.]MDP2417745.1 Rpn family recombination-promoting nuclease/putative transposase [Hydrogenophaga sp.]MDZ4188104.1 Rpn family recombination-promoting nuclease/putative transposase [Hydrogenophaga sp.]